ncbi:aspartate/glutamate racemase family protein [Microbacterium sp. LWH11-1.2]|uniref:aspartate/glutamate racemase family protein n=1 Tax=Microbacterium sp. LWH11-1.2 TaxID=3135258 RepID=UPI0031392572
MHLRVINPTVSTEREATTLALLTGAAASGTRVSAATLPAGVASIESRRDDALVTPWVLRAAREAEADRCDAILVDDMLDPGVHAAREVVDVPVLGSAEASMHLAATLGHRFAVITATRSTCDPVIEHARRFGVAPKLTSTRSLDIPTAEIGRDPEAALASMVRCARATVELDGAEVIVLGLTGVGGHAPAVTARLAQDGIDVPVIDPSVTALRMLESIVEMGLRSSRRTFARRPGATSSWPEPAGAGDARPMV